jgi:hypothetical protein
LSACWLSMRPEIATRRALKCSDGQTGQLVYTG